MKKILLTTATVALGLLLAACGQKQTAAPAAKKLTPITVMLDYVPNTNHTGLYVAKAKNYYKQAGLNVKIVTPGDDTSGSISLVGANKAQFGVSYQEDVTYAHSDDQNIPVTAIAAVIQHNTSGFVTAKSSGITSPKQFENKVYAGWQSPSEVAILHAAMEKAGADPKKLKIVGATGEGPKQLGHGVDIQWYFEAWDNIKAKEDKIGINYIPLNKLDSRLDYYTPVIIANNQLIKQQPKVVQAFMDATKRGYQYAIEHPSASATILHKATPTTPLAFLKASQAYLSPRYTDNPNDWGVMQAKVWTNYTDFMTEAKLIKTTQPNSQLFTNRFIEAK